MLQPSMVRTLRIASQSDGLAATYDTSMARVAGGRSLAMRAASGCGGVIGLGLDGRTKHGRVLSLVAAMTVSALSSELDDKMGVVLSMRCAADLACSRCESRSRLDRALLAIPIWRLRMAC